MLKGIERGAIDYDMYCQLIDRMNWHLCYVDLCLGGEPLLAPRIYDMIRYAADRRIFTYISTNLHALNLERGDADRLVDSGLARLGCSLHGTSQETFEAFQPGKKFDETMARLKAVLEARQRRGRMDMEVELYFAITRANEHEVEAFQQLASELGCRPVIKKASMATLFLNKGPGNTRLAVSPEDRRQHLKEHLDQWLPKNQDYICRPYQLMLQDDYDPSQCNGRKLVRCRWPWSYLVVQWDGMVLACGSLFDPDEYMGNVLREPLSQIWNNTSFRMARRSFTRPAPEPADHANPCRTCPGYRLEPRP